MRKPKGNISMKPIRIKLATVLALLAATHTLHAEGSNRDLTPPQLLAYKLVQKVIPEYIITRSSEAKQPVTVSQILLCAEIYVPTDPILKADLSAWKTTALPEVPSSSFWEGLQWPVWLVQRHGPNSKRFDYLYSGQVYLEFMIDAKGQVIAEIRWARWKSIRIALTVESGEPVIKETLLVETKACN